MITPPGTTWHHLALALPSITWHHLVPPGTTGYHVDPAGTTWHYLTSPGTTWYHQVPPGTIWTHFGTILVHFETSWITCHGTAFQSPPTPLLLLPSLIIKINSKKKKQRTQWTGGHVDPEAQNATQHSQRYIFSPQQLTAPFN